MFDLQANEKFKVFCSLALLALAISLFSFAHEFVEVYNDAVRADQLKKFDQASNRPSFSFTECFPDNSRGFYRTFSFFVMILAVYSSRRRKFYLSSAFLSASAFLLYVSWLIRWGGRAIENEIWLKEWTISEQIFSVANPFDYSLFSILPFIIFWQFRFGFRMLLARFRARSDRLI